ncbi:hypothetical protein CDL60_13950 [Roseateles noduli]|nr:hypothetical protein CDL60_13950 [Roseateles noduli]
MPSLDLIAQQAGISLPEDLQPRFNMLPVLAVILDETGAPVWEATLFLAYRALRSRSQTGDSVRSYAEALLVWLAFLNQRRIAPVDATEETLGIYSAKLVHVGHTRPLSATTSRHRITVASLFHQWGVRSGSMTSPLGRWLVETGYENQIPDPRRYGRSIKRLGIAPPPVQRLPRILSREEISRLFLIAPMPYRLMFRWALATGMRRFEVCGLCLNQLPQAEIIASSDDGLLPIDVLRKGGRLCTVYAPVALIEETNWYALMDRPQSGAREVFVNTRGAAISRHRLTSVFRRCADRIGTKATLHNLRHTFAVHVLRILEGYERRGDAMNSLKTLQVLLGHSSIETTEIYLRAVEVSGEPVEHALKFLYGNAIE